MCGGFSELLLSTTIRPDVGPLTPANSAAVSPPWKPGCPNVIEPLTLPLLPLPDESAAATLPIASPRRQKPIGPSARTSAAKLLFAMMPPLMA